MLLRSKYCKALFIEWLNGLGFKALIRIGLRALALKNHDPIPKSPPPPPDINHSHCGILNQRKES